MASGYDLNSKVPFRLLKGRLGVYESPKSNYASSSLEGVDLQNVRLQGNTQQERMILDKRRSLNHALYYSYQGAKVVKTDAADRTPVRALINPNKLKMDYDDKIISVGYEYNFAPGTVFEWLGTKTFWIVYLQDITELAYFRGDIRKCSYEIAWEDEGGLHKTYAAVRGPVETKINYIQKHGISIDTPNHSLSLLMPKNEYVLKYFERYKKFYLQGDPTCWRVEAIDWISTPGVLEVTAVEYYSNEVEDDVEAGIVGGLIEDIKDPNPVVQEEYEISGETFIKVKTPVEYMFTGTVAKNWRVDSKCPVELSLNLDDPRKVIVTWLSGYSGQFDLYYGDYKKTIVVQSLF